MGCYICFPDVVEKRCLAVVNMSHDGDNRGSDHFFVSGLRSERIGELFFDYIFRDEFDLVPHLFNQQAGGIMIQDLINGSHDSHIEQNLDDFGGLYRHLLRQIGNTIGLGNRYFTRYEFCRLLEGMLLGGDSSLAATTTDASSTSTNFIEVIALQHKVIIYMNSLGLALGGLCLGLVSEVRLLLSDVVGLCLGLAFCSRFGGTSFLRWRNFLGQSRFGLGLACRLSFYCRSIGLGLISPILGWC